MFIADMIARHMANENNINRAQPGIISAGNGTTRVIHNASLIRVFKDHGAVELAKFTRLALGGDIFTSSARAKWPVSISEPIKALR
jgi:hypothetical protein